MSDTRLSPTPCPLCGYTLDAASPAPFEADQAATPRAGDITMCLKCGEPLLFDAQVQPRVMTDGEWLALPAPLRRNLTRLRAAARQIDWRRTP